MGAAERLMPPPQPEPPDDPNVGRKLGMVEWLDLCELTGIKYERHNGVVVLPPEAMSGARRDHNVAAGDVERNLENLFEGRGGDCTAFGSDQAVRSEELAKDVYPDVSVVCGEERYLDPTGDRILANPCLIVEVLSPSTRNYDRGDKFDLYRTIPTVREYVMIDSTKVEVILCRRQETGWLMLTYTSPEDVVRLESVRADLKVSDVYRRVRFRDAESAAE